MRTHKRAFTIIELLVVIAIIGILSTVVFLNYDSSKAKSRDAKRISDVDQLKTAIGLYAEDNDQYPQCDSTTPPDSLGYQPDCYYGYSSYITEVNMPSLKPYLDPFPRDPKSNIGYVYVTGDHTPGAGGPSNPRATDQYGFLMGFETPGTKQCVSGHYNSDPANYYKKLPAGAYQESGQRCICKTGSNMNPGWWGSVSAVNGGVYTYSSVGEVPNCS